MTSKPASANHPSHLEVAISLQSSDRRYHGRYPSGDAPSIFRQRIVERDRQLAALEEQLARREQRLGDARRQVELAEQQMSKSVERARHEHHGQRVQTVHGIGEHALKLEELRRELVSEEAAAGIERQHLRARSALLLRGQALDLLSDAESQLATALQYIERAKSLLRI
jgi:hypothetical protein